MESWLGEQQVLEQVSISQKTLRKFVHEGRIHPKRGYRTVSNGSTRMVFLYDPAEVNRIPSMLKRAQTRDPGKLAAEMFERFDRGLSFRQIVREMQQPPSVVYAHHEQWLDCGGGEMVINPLAARQIARLVGPFDGVADLVDKIRALCEVRIEATVPDDATDADVERGIIAILDEEERARSSPRVVEDNAARSEAEAKEAKVKEAEAKEAEAKEAEAKETSQVRSASGRESAADLGSVE